MRRILDMLDELAVPAPAFGGNAGTLIHHFSSLERQHMSGNAKTTSTSDPLVRRDVALALAAGLLIVVAFQAALTLGAPLGAAAQGGTNPGRLPDELRVASGIGGLIFLFARWLCWPGAGAT